MASSTFTIEICDEDRRRIDALVEALKKSEGLSKLLEQRDLKLSVVAESDIEKRLSEVESWIDRRESYESEQREYGPE